MERYRLPLPSLLGLFGALLILSLELFLGIAGVIFEPPVTNPVVQGVLAFVMEKYNKATGDSTNYYKLLQLVKVVRETGILDTYHFMVLLVQTRCEKRAGMIMTYENFQKCPLLPGNQKKLNCYFRAVKRGFPMYGMALEATSCTPSVQELFCSG